MVTRLTSLALADALTNLINAISNNPGYFAIRGGVTLAILLLALAGGRLLSDLAGRVPIRLESHWIKENGEHKQTVSNIRTTFSGLIGRFTSASVWLAALVAISFTWLYNGQPSNADLTQLTQKLTDIAGKIVATFVVIAVTLAMARLMQRVVLGSVGRGGTNRNIVVLTGRLIFTATLIIGLVVILAIWSTSIVLPVALVGALTVALSLALQDVLKNLVSGIYLLLERPFVIGDYISLSTYTGEIEDIQIRYTALRTADNQRVLIPNSVLFSSPVVNLSAYTRRRAALAVSVPDAGSDGMDSVEERIRSALEKVPGVLSEPGPRVTLSRASEGKLDLNVVFWMPTHQFGENAGIYSAAIERVREQLGNAEVAPLDATSVAV